MAGTEVAPAWQPYGGIWAHYLSKPLTFHVDGGGADEVVVESMVQLQAAVGFGLAGIGELELVMPLTLTSKGDATRLAGVGDFGAGDLLARLRFALLTRKDGKDGFGLNLGVTVGIPTGDASAASGDGGVTIEPTLALSAGIGPVLIALDAGVGVRTETLAFANLNFDHELTFGLGAQVQATDFLAIGAEIFGRAALSNPFAENPETPVEVVGGVKFRALGGLHVEVGGGTGIVHGYGAPEWRVFGGVQWAPYVNDPDTDGDGIHDSKDKCPTVPEDKDGFEDDDGCPDLDDDKDGIPDTADKCRLEPEDKDGFEDSDGCPDVDNDKDNIPDSQDKCRDIPEDRDGFEDEDGCPDPDNDHDGILDDIDKCIDQPETENGYQDEDGCPDTPPLARLENCKIVIGEKVYFDTNKATIKPVSFPLLNEVARIIRDNPGIVRVDIEGHTDSDGSVAHNRGLSDRRAKAVRTYLVGQGLKAAKLTGKGYGEDMPIAPNVTPEDKEKNRRVEFMVKNAECKR